MIGTIAIVFGILGALGGCLGLVMGPVMKALFEVMPTQQAAGMSWMSEWQWWMLTGSLLGLTLGVLLLVGGLGLQSRRGWGRRVCLGWAGLKVLLVVVNAIIQFQMALDQAEAMKNDPNVQAMPAQFAIIMESFGMIGVIVGVIWGWALPVFLLVWLSRRKIRAEVQSWSEISPSADS